MVEHRLRLGGHSLLGKIAFSTLPQWEKKIIQPDMSPRALNKPYLPRGIKTVEEKAGAMCSILDWIYYKEMRPYAILPDGRWIPHSPPDRDCQSSSGSGQPRSHIVHMEMIEWLLKKMLNEVQRKRWEEAIRYGGALGHFLQEPFTPGHAIDNNLFHQLFPDPDRKRHIRLHSRFDAASDRFKPLTPVLMGTTVSEAAFRLLIEIDRGIKEGMKIVGRLIDSVYKGEPKSEQERILSQQCRQAVFVTASAWHTVMCIGFNRFNKKEVERLKSLNLTYLVPYFIHHCQYFDILLGNLVKEERKIPIYVWGRNGKEELIKNGFGMGGHSGIKFFINGDVYTRFRCRVGLPSRHTEGQTGNTRTMFFVEIDTEENLTYSEDMEYEAKRIVSLPLIPGEPVHSIDICIKGARTLILTTRSSPYTTCDGKIQFDIPHVAICDPVLYKS
ncbi:MAG TPA: hypothetical protein PLQ41_03015 [bacterium]|nr:hypothetical protein [bacterium]HPP30013.1 hypothetical protein [bacterium]